ncbi:Downstream Neighbor of SoN homolog [Caenorhabditis elegans]|uniref:Downstream Neighbor of SoN homolog n=1 Tax=Caenorhabditis elegans TaxID=6239 RepID=H1ZUV7_CAEEL|nr:Downstream Neighbor of SoN homolog [Caenorhabditis elegans]8OUW_F Chain F, Downstream Neighbor of SoN homolog [Caenorhabditis elegans]8OUW_G Chain G, Downstream Neighbor of SoN homolog [Caenorhabditis elegans]8OUW_H Chain H, Downstream Neighbor of SoN homolog [Caenorhabditis elegans]CCF23335.1 Downstream Neighbor of SoN homolog [Caenorhabditis elegans]|eukprot:NP_001254011.1 Downstream Neighbor of SoN homolog [Caenorhabditis elegans]
MSDEHYNPRNRLKTQIKRRSSCRNILNAVPPPPPTDFEGLEGFTDSCPAPTANNPFKVSSPQKKRQKPQVTFSQDDPFAASISRSPDPLKTPTKGVRSSPRKRKSPQKFERFQSFDPALLQEFHPVDFSALLATSSSAQKPAEPAQESAEDLPTDLRIGSKMRIVSKVSFPWMNTRKSTGNVIVKFQTNDRFDGMQYFNKTFLNGYEDPTVPLPVSPMSILEAASLFYQFPVIPGLKMYPRITAEQENVSRVSLAPLVTSTMLEQWQECYAELYSSYKKGQRGSFYVATAVCNVLFTKMPLSGGGDDVAADDTSQSCSQAFRGQKLVAVITHTTSAIREHLRSQGVDFEAPKPTSSLKRVSSSPQLHHDQSTLDCLLASESKENSQMGPTTFGGIENSENSDESPLKKDQDSDENESPMKLANQWLNEIGVSPRTVKNTVSRELSSQVTDRAGFQCLVVHGSKIHALFNALMDSDVVHEKTGPYTKIPPTLIATSPFLYGQLLSLTKSSNIFAKAGTKCTEYELKLENGPVLPHCAKMMTQFIRSTNMCSTEEKPVTMQVMDRHTSQGMSDWTETATNWNTVTIAENCVKWTKN